MTHTKVGLSGSADLRTNSSAQDLTGYGSRKESLGKTPQE